MIPLSDMKHHEMSEEIVKILCRKTQNTQPLFFRVMVAYYFSVVASMMRASIQTLDRGEIPINLYAINLAPSGYGKGYSTNVMEEQVIHKFRQEFVDNTFPMVTEQHLPKVALKRAQRGGRDPDDELEKAYKEFEQQGPLPFSFDSATIAAIKQIRHKLLLANAGSLNLQIDEIGSNLLGNIDVLTVFLELYDVGRLKQKLIKNTNENVRHEEISGRTPTNMMLFGTPIKLLNGGKVEEELYSMLDTGFSRRCLYSYERQHVKTISMSAEEILAQRTDTKTTEYIEAVANHFQSLADVSHFQKKITVSREITIKLIEYQLICENLANALPEHEEMRKAELSHRHFKCLKLAGAYAFVSGDDEITEEHLYSAIKVCEESGEAFDSLLTRDRSYVKLAKYLAATERNVTQADLVEDLPFYRVSVSQKQEMMNLAIAYGYQNNILIKRSFSDGVEFIRGSSLKPTDEENIIISYSDSLSHGYRRDYAPFDQLHVLTQSQGLHWANHHFKDNHRKEDKVISGFNLIVLDVDEGVNLSTAKMLLKDYKAHYYTTKRHEEDNHRFRIMLPTNYILELDSDDYKEFMTNLCEWLPFEVDNSANQRARKWLSHDAHYEYTDGMLLDVLPFVPKTSKNDQRKDRMNELHNLDSLERWVLNSAGEGNRNNMLLRYAYILLDAGFNFEDIRQKVNSLNEKMPSKLDEAEIMGTIMVTISRAISERVR